MALPGAASDVARSLGVTPNSVQKGAAGCSRVRVDLSEGRGGQFMSEEKAALVSPVEA
ncbi:MAG: hypothetical protein ACOY3Y_09550 [Acidobacteriota bacterium]